MTKTWNAKLLPTALLVMVGVLLVVLLIRAQIALAPVPTGHQLTLTGPGAPAAQTSSNPAAQTQQTVQSNGTTAPLSGPTPGPQNPVSESTPAPGSARCPSQAHSGLPCTIP
jgi:hypothetical protein